METWADNSCAESTSRSSGSGHPYGLEGRTGCAGNSFNIHPIVSDQRHLCETATPSNTPLAGEACSAIDDPHLAAPAQQNRPSYCGAGASAIGDWSCVSREQSRPDSAAEAATAAAAAALAALETHMNRGFWQTTGEGEFCRQTGLSEAAAPATTAAWLLPLLQLANRTMFFNKPQHGDCESAVFSSARMQTAPRAIVDTVVATPRAGADNAGSAAALPASAAFLSNGVAQPNDNFPMMLYKDSSEGVVPARNHICPLNSRVQKNNRAALAASVCAASQMEASGMDLTAAWASLLQGDCLEGSLTLHRQPHLQEPDLQRQHQRIPLQPHQQVLQQQHQQRHESQKEKQEQHSQYQQQHQKQQEQERQQQNHEQSKQQHSEQLEQRWPRSVSQQRQYPVCQQWERQQKKSREPPQPCIPQQDVTLLQQQQKKQLDRDANRDKDRTELDPLHDASAVPKGEEAAGAAFSAAAGAAVKKDETVLGVAAAVEPAEDVSLNSISLEYTYEELYAATAGFSVMLGQGAYGSVYKGVLRDGGAVAIKWLHKPKEAGFEKEVRVLSKFRHPNLVILLGFARHNTDRFLVYELLVGGDVGARLQNGPVLSWSDRLGLALDAACALSHLQHRCPQVFHRDIKTANILLDKHNGAKVADFGLACLAKKGEDGCAVQQTAGTVGYADPRYITSAVVTERTEVYSFGIVLLELLTARAPTALNADGSVTYLLSIIGHSVRRAVRYADPRANFPPPLAEAVAVLAFSCIQDEEMNRPTFRELVHCLRLLCNSGSCGPRSLGSASGCKNVSPLEAVALFRLSSAPRPPLKIAAAAGHLPQKKLILQQQKAGAAVGARKQISVNEEHQQQQDQEQQDRQVVQRVCSNVLSAAAFEAQRYGSCSANRGTEVPCTLRAKETAKRCVDAAAALSTMKVETAIRPATPEEAGRRDMFLFMKRQEAPSAHACWERSDRLTNNQELQLESESTRVASAAAAAALLPRTPVRAAPDLHLVSSEKNERMTFEEQQAVLQKAAPPVDGPLALALANAGGLACIPAADAIPATFAAATAAAERELLASRAAGGGSKNNQDVQAQARGQFARNAVVDAVCTGLETARAADAAALQTNTQPQPEEHWGKGAFHMQGYEGDSLSPLARPATPATAARNCAKFGSGGAEKRYDVPDSCKLKGRKQGREALEKNLIIQKQAPAQQQDPFSYFPQLAWKALQQQQQQLVLRQQQQEGRQRNNYNGRKKTEEGTNEACLPVPLLALIQLLTKSPNYPAALAAAASSNCSAAWTMNRANQSSSATPPSEQQRVDGKNNQQPHIQALCNNFCEGYSRSRGANMALAHAHSTGHENKGTYGRGGNGGWDGCARQTVVQRRKQESDAAVLAELLSNIVDKASRNRRSDGNAVPTPQKESKPSPGIKAGIYGSSLPSPCNARIAPAQGSAAVPLPNDIPREQRMLTATQQHRQHRQPTLAVSAAAYPAAIEGPQEQPQQQQQKLLPSVCCNNGDIRQLLNAEPSDMPYGRIKQPMLAIQKKQMHFQQNSEQYGSTFYTDIDRPGQHHQQEKTWMTPTNQEIQCMKYMKINENQDHAHTLFYRQGNMQSKDRQQRKGRFRPLVVQQQQQKQHRNANAGTNKQPAVAPPHAIAAPLTASEAVAEPNNPKRENSEGSEASSGNTDCCGSSTSSTAAATPLHAESSMGDRMQTRRAAAIAPPDDTGAAAGGAKATLYNTTAGGEATTKENSSTAVFVGNAGTNLAGALAGNPDGVFRLTGINGKPAEVLKTQAARVKELQTPLRPIHDSPTEQPLSSLLTRVTSKTPSPKLQLFIQNRNNSTHPVSYCVRESYKSQQGQGFATAEKARGRRRRGSLSSVVHSLDNNSSSATCTTASENSFIGKVKNYDGLNNDIGVNSNTFPSDISFAAAERKVRGHHQNGIVPFPEITEAANCETYMSQKERSSVKEAKLPSTVAKASANAGKCEGFCKDTALLLRWLNCERTTEGKDQHSHRPQQYKRLRHQQRFQCGPPLQQQVRRPQDEVLQPQQQQTSFLYQQCKSPQADVTRLRETFQEPGQNQPDDQQRDQQACQYETFIRQSSMQPSSRFVSTQQKQVQQQRQTHQQNHMRFTPNQQFCWPSQEPPRQHSNNTHIPLPNRLPSSGQQWQPRQPRQRRYAGQQQWQQSSAVQQQHHRQQSKAQKQVAGQRGSAPQPLQWPSQQRWQSFQYCANEK